MTNSDDLNGSRGTGLVKSTLTGWCDLVHRFPVPVLLCAALFTVLSVFATVRYLGVDTNTEGMLSGELAFRQDFLEFKKAFPHLNNIILVAVQGNDRRVTRRSAGRLAERLRTKSDLFSEVSYPEGDPFFNKHFLLYRSTRHLQRLTRRLDGASPLLVPAVLDRSLLGVSSGVSRLVDRSTDGTGRIAATTTPLLRDMNRSVSSLLEGNLYRMKWHQALAGARRSGAGGSPPSPHTSVLLVKPNLSFDSLLPGDRALDQIRASAKQVQSASDGDLQIGLTGQIALQNDELRQAMNGVMLGGTLSLVLVMIILYVALRSLKLVLFSLITLLVGLSWTFGFSALAIGDLNLISIAFVVLYIGLGIDYAIHYGLIYLESREQTSSTAEALRRTSGLVGRSLLVCSITTAIGFYAFIPTAYVGISELGLIGGTGMFVSLIVTLSVFPALLSLSPYGPTRSLEHGTFQSIRSILRIPLTYRWSFLVMVVLGAGVLGWMMTGLSFTYNPMTLRDPESPSVRTYLDLFETDSPPLSIHVLADSRVESKQLNSDLDELETVKQVRTIGDFLPDRQSEKRTLLRNSDLLNQLRNEADARDVMRFTQQQASGSDVGKTFTPQEAPLNEVRSSMRSLVQTIDAALPEDDRTAFHRQLERLRGSFKRVLTRLEEGSAEEQQSLVNRLRTALLSRFGRVLHIVYQSATVEELTEDDLPDRIVDRWKDRKGQYRVDVFPAQQTTDNDALREFVTSVRAVSPSATGPPVIYLEAGQAVVQAFLWAFAIAVVAMSGYLLFQLQRSEDVLLVMVPLLLAGVYVCGFMGLLGYSFNYANVIVLPLLLGIGADNSIHLIHRFRNDRAAVTDILRTSTARAVFFSVITTTGSFCNLILSPHRGMSSMGVVLTLGMGIILFTTMCLLPVLLSIRENG